MERGAVIETDLAACGRRNVTFTYVELARTVPGARVERHDAFISVTAPIKLSFCNFALDFDLVGRDTAAAMQSLRRVMEGKEIFRAFHIPVTSDDPTAGILKSHGWRCQHSLIQMGWRPGSVVATVPLVPCVTPEERFEVAIFMVEQFFWRQTSAMRQAILDATVASSHAMYRLGDPGQVEAAVMTCKRPDSLGLYNLCVDRNLRGRGIGGSIVRSIQGMAAHANVPVVLQCEAGLGTWYAYHGFNKVGIIESYGLIR